MRGAALWLRPSQNPEFSSLQAMSFSPYVLRHGPSLATPVRGRREAFVPGIQPKGSDGSCHHSSSANQDPLGGMVTITMAPVLARGFGSIT
jgi:hypothetical protein